MSEAANTCRQTPVDAARVRAHFPTIYFIQKQFKKIKMYKSVILFCVVCVVIEARPKWQSLPPVPGYVPVYIRNGDTPLEEINLELAEAFHALPAGRSAGKELEASQEIPEQADQPQPEAPEHLETVDHRPYEKKVLEKKKKASAEIPKPIERR